MKVRIWGNPRTTSNLFVLTVQLKMNEFKQNGQFEN